MTASVMRALHPARVERYSMSDLNPWLWPLGAMAESVRNHRNPTSRDNPFVALEQHISGLIEDSLDHYRDQRDQFSEQMFKVMYDSPWMAMLLGARRNRRGPMSLRTQLERLNIKSALHDFDHGGALDAFVRVVAYIRAEEVIDVRPFNMMRRIMSEQRVEAVSLKEYRDAVQRQCFVLMLDEERAMAALPKLIPDVEMRRTVMDFVHEVLSAAGPLEPAVEQRYRDVANLLELECKVDFVINSATTKPSVRRSSKSAAPRK
jgi:hypothetical protein